MCIRCGEHNLVSKNENQEFRSYSVHSPWVIGINSKSIISSLSLLLPRSSSLTPAWITTAWKELASYFRHPPSTLPVLYTGTKSLSPEPSLLFARVRNKLQRDPGVHARYFHVKWRNPTSQAKHLILIYLLYSIDIPCSKTKASWKKRFLFSYVQYP